MKLRGTKEDPFVVLEAGEQAAVERVVLTLDRAADIVGGVAANWLKRVAADIEQVALGDAPGVRLPKKRAPKIPEETGKPWLQVAEAPQASVSKDNEVTRNLCPNPECNRLMTRAEVRQGECYFCKPIEEVSA